MLLEVDHRPHAGGVGGACAPTAGAATLIPNHVYRAHTSRTHRCARRARTARHSSLWRDAASTAIDGGRWHFVQRLAGTGDQSYPSSKLILIIIGQPMCLNRDDNAWTWTEPGKDSDGRRRRDNPRSH